MFGKKPKKAEFRAMTCDYCPKPATITMQIGKQKSQVFCILECAYNKTGYGCIPADKGE